MPQTFYEVVWIFIIYAFIGWCAEVSFAALNKGVFVNRGFLNGPYCPIYGCGVLAVVVALTPLKDNLLLLFLGSMVLTTVLEFITGFILEKAFHDQWWDYSDEPFNIKGYVCLKFSVMWGLACVFIMRIIHPIIYGFIRWIPFPVGATCLVVIMICFLVDIIVTVSTIIKFNRRLRLLDEMAAKLKVVSNKIGENVYENVMDALEKKEEFEENHSELLEGLEEKKDAVTEKVDDMREKYEELTRSYHELFHRENRISTRLMKAFPGMKSREHNDILKRMKDRNTKSKK